MSTPERQQDADPEKGTGYGATDHPDHSDVEKRRQSEPAGQRGNEETPDASRSDDQRSDADQAKENERKAEAEGTELPG